MRARKKENDQRIGVLDFETDPFEFGRVPCPFAAGVYFSKDDYFLVYGEKVNPNAPRTVREFLARLNRDLRRLPACILYAHNGGKFDFHFLIEYANPGEIVVRNGRVTEMHIGKVLLKDSWPLMPFALAQYRKTPIDYTLFEYPRRTRPENRAKIEAYLFDDCRDLHELVTGFRAIVGDRDTIGAAAFLQMRKLGIKIKTLNEAHDDMLRPYYFGGRVQAFKRGIFKGRFEYLDINSAYPYAMMNDHAHGAEYEHHTNRRKITPQSFVRAICKSAGCLPLRAEDGSLSFPHGEGEFYATGWEIQAGIKTRTLEIKKILDVWTPQTFINFSDYVRHFYAARLEAKRVGDSIGALAYKYLLNSGYGKFAQNPRDFKDYFLAPFGKAVKGYDWETDFGAVSLWSKPSYKGWGFYDVATGASITGFVRAYLWTAIQRSSEVIYCDTDSLLCRSSRVPRGDALGAWKLEGIAKRAAIAGKKLFAIEWQTPQKGEKYRVASKGARLEFADILSLCNGDTVEWENDAPTFTLGNPHFIRREIRATGI